MLLVLDEVFRAGDRPGAAEEGEVRTHTATFRNSGGVSRRAFLTSIFAAVVIAIGSMLVVDRTWQRQADEAFTSPTSVRIPSHGDTHNLVGKGWFSAKDH
jgi:hypothetical protein